MFRSPTVFVLGAGASKEANLPVGYELKKIISSMLDYQFTRYQLSSGDTDFIQIFKRVAGPTDLAGALNIAGPIASSYIRASQSIHDGLLQAASIDDYLYTHKSDERIQFCGKLAIVKSILQAEQSSSLYVSHNSPIELSELEETWYHVFFQMLHEGVALEDLESIFDNLTFIIFNYDRCLEQFLYYALIKYYRISESRCAEIIGKLKIIRPYGKVGNLPWQDSTSTSFGSVPHDLENYVGQIKTFNEQIEDPKLTNDITTAITACNKLIFLGFAFHKQNLALLRCSNVVAKRIYATGFGLSKPHCESLENDLRALIRSNVYMGVHVNPLTQSMCYQFLLDYKMALSD